MEGNTRPNLQTAINLSKSTLFLDGRQYLDTFNIWINDTVKCSPKKSNATAETYRKLGNSHYAKEHFKESITFYTRSLHFALCNGIQYGKALANRSAATFELKEYEECLRDIEACLTSAYPDDLRSKLLLRKLQVFYHLNMDEEFFVQVQEMWPAFANNEVFMKYVKSYKGNMKSAMYPNTIKHAEITMNSSFAFATDMVELKYNPSIGRHVVAAKDIKPGDILFEEKAFIIAQIFISEAELSPETCYNCLKHIPYFSLPCPSCVYCLYCSERCKKISWMQSHQFECEGMILFYELGYALPAFKFLMKGIFTGFAASDEKSVDFGGRVCNSPWANSLTMHYKCVDRTVKEENKHLFAVAVITSIYLRNITSFYEYLETFRPSSEDIEDFIINQLFCNILKLSMNGSLIERQISPNVKQPIAAGLYPSISMMNHSCKPNISIKFDGSIAVVTAAEAIPKDAEVFNCYGVDFTIDRKTRQKYLKDTFKFDCFCPVCLDECK